MPGSHGSLTKAGKVKNQTPKVDRRGVNSNPKKIPRLRYREAYLKRVIKGEYGGQQDSIGAKRRY
jgi:small subunit ribosomal protein S30e